MPSWFHQLDRAQDAADVVEIARDYFATWTPEELARLPRACRPGHVRTPSDIDDLHGSAVDAYRATRASGEELKALQILTTFLVHASLRLAQLRPAQSDDDSPVPPPPPPRQSQPRDY